MDGIVDDFERAEYICSKSKSATTVKKYQQKINRLKKYCEEKHPECIINGKLIIEQEEPEKFPDEVIIGFLGSEMYLIKDRDTPQKKMRQPMDMQCFKSAILDLYLRNNIPFNDSMKMKRFDQTWSRGVKRIRNGENKEEIGCDEERVGPGKSPLKVETFKYLAMLALQSSRKAEIACYQIFMWNLIARSINVSNLQWRSLSWSVDHLNVYQQFHKGDQQGNWVS
jgi:hypothetical protein